MTLRNRSPRWSTSPIFLFVLMLLWSLILGWGAAHLTLAHPIGSMNLAQLEPAQPSIPSPFDTLDPTPTNQPDPKAPRLSGPLDPVPTQYHLGEDLYLNACATCHIGLPPPVLPSETWRQLLQQAQHYGTYIIPLKDPSRLLVWTYLRDFSRPLQEEEEVPYRLSQSRYFKAMHPNVALPKPISTSACITCHPTAAQYNFRTLTSQW